MQTDPLSEAVSFLSPVLNSTEKVQHKSPRSTTLIGRLSTSLPDALPVSESNGEPGLVITHATCLLQKIHTYFLARNRPTFTQDDVLPPKDRQVIIALLDLLALEGIYPCLAPGVGVPLERRAKAIIPSSSQHLTGAIRKVRQVRTLIEVVLLFTGILQGGQGEVFKLLRDRCLVDVLAGCGELGFNPSEDNGLTSEEKETWRMRWEAVIEGITTPQLLPVLMSLIHSQCPQWFLVPVTSKLSTIPVHRPNAVRHILQMFLAAPHSTTFGNSSSIPDIPLDALAKAARLLGSVPRTVSPEKWFHIVGQQLLELVRGSRDEGLRRASSYVIAEFLAKKSFENIIDREIVFPILKDLDPACATRGAPKADNVMLSNIERKTGTSNVLLELEGGYNESSSTIPLSQPKSLISALADKNPKTYNLDPPHDGRDSPPLVAEPEILSALQTLSFLLKSHPTPLAPEKMLKPILLPLWGLMCFSRDKRKGAQWRDLPRALLVSYAKMVGVSVTMHDTSMREKGPIEVILYNLGYTGAESWEFCNGEYGGVEIRVRQAHGEKLNMEAVDVRVEEFMKLLQDVQVGEDGSLIAALFLHILSGWLGGLGGQKAEDPLRVLIRLKILQQILSNHADKLGKRPVETLQVVHNIIGEYVTSRKAFKEERIKQSTTSPSLNRLGSIIDPRSISTPIRSTDFRGQGYINWGEDEQMDESVALASNEESDSMERMTITLSLLSSMIANPEVQFTEQEERLLQTLILPLQFLSNAPPDLVNSSISSLATHISSYLTFITPNNINIAHTASSPPEPTLIEQEKATYKTIMSYITDPLVPVRAHGIYLLRQLILARSPILDIPITLRLLLSMIKDTDSFVYLNVIKCLQSLSEKHPHTVVRLLVKSYMDDSGTMTLDERLRVGEALLGTVQREGRMLMGDVAQAITQGMVEVVSRRRRREDKSLEEGGGDGDAVKEIISAFEVPEGQIVEKSKKVKEEEELDESTNILPLHSSHTQELHLRTIKNWLPPPGTNLEDIRIRTSALSILSAAVDTNPLGIGATSGEVAMDISLAILQLETTPEKDILRRAAMVCLESLVKSHGQPGGGWVRGRLDQAKQVVEYIQVVDGDGLVREQGRQVAELIDEVWMEIMSLRPDKGHHMFNAC